MDTLMSLQVAELREGLVTIRVGTLVGPFPGMLSLVSLENV